MTQNYEADTKADTIVVGIDGSDCSIKALEEGAKLAYRLGCKLKALSIWHYPYMGNPGYVYPDSIALVKDTVRAAAQEILDAAARRVFGEQAPDWYSSEIAQGRPGLSLVESSKGARMLIVGSRGHGGLAGLMLGSVSMTCAEHAECPVLIFHDEDETLVKDLWDRKFNRTAPEDYLPERAIKNLDFF